jgi:pimeloyl-ACP methyl ester carboxylesterase
LTEADPSTGRRFDVVNVAATTLRRGQEVAIALHPSKFIDAASRTGGFALRSLRMDVQPSRRKYPEVPVARPTLPVVASVFAEELMLLVAGGMDELTRDPAELQRIGREVDRALAVMDRNGWLDDPASYHLEPTAPEPFELESGALANLRYQRLSFESGYQPADGLAGGDRWLAWEPNRRCYAHVLEHREGARPWLVFVHGYAMGGPFDLAFQRSLHFHRDLGFNVLAPVLPLHGPRRTGRRSGTGFVSIDWLTNVHALTQAVWDVRRCLAWIRGRDARSVALHGMSLGGYTAAMVAGLDATLDCVIAGVPSSTIHGSLVAAAERNPLVRRAVENQGLLGERTEAVHRVVTPTAFPCRVPRERRFIYAGVADRLATPGQPYALWEHWDRPEICWSVRSHIFTARSAKVRRFVEKAVVDTADGTTG